MWFMYFEALRHGKEELSYEFHRYIGEIVFQQDKGKGKERRHLRPPLPKKTDDGKGFYAIELQRSYVESYVIATTRISIRGRLSSYLCLLIEHSIQILSNPQLRYKCQIASLKLLMIDVMIDIDCFLHTVSPQLLYEVTGHTIADQVGSKPVPAAMR